jgi:dTDP-4-amino-4,6-dideoxygalactose transaminase
MAGNSSSMKLENAMQIVENVPLANPYRDLARYEADFIEVTRRVIHSGSYIGGPEVVKFEGNLAASVGTPASAGLGSGTDALIFAMQAAGIGPGDEVIAPSHTAGPSIAAIHALKATPVFVDVDADTACIGATLVEAAVSPRTKAILAVHLYGHPAQLDQLLPLAQKHGLSLIEDCAQAQGATFAGRPVGSFGAFGCFSFYPTKNLGALGDGGAVTGTEQGIDLVRKLRTYGWSTPQYAELQFGRCSRLDELQAGFLNVRLSGLVDDVNARRRVAQIYREGMSGLPIDLPVEKANCQHAYHLFVIKSDHRDELQRHLAGANIMTGLHYPFPTHLQPGLAANARIGSSLAVTEKLQKTILSLPMFSTMSDAEIAKVIDGVRRFFGS